MYTQCNVKRQKVTRDSRSSAAENVENFPGIGKVEFKPDCAHNVEDSLFYRYYNGSERIHGRSMEEWIKPSVYVGQAFSPNEHQPKRPWSERIQSVDNYKKAIRAAFEMCIKLGVKLWSGYDSDIAPMGETVEETNRNFEQVAELISEYQSKTGIKPLWIGVDFRSVHFNNGAITNPDALIVAYAGYRIKRALDMAHKLNSECLLLCGIQEGFDISLNTDIGRDLKFLAKFCRMIVDYRDKIGYRGQLLFQSVYYHPKKPDKRRRYLSSTFSLLTFLKHHNLDRYFKLNVQPGLDFNMSNAYNCLGSVDILHELSATDAAMLLKNVVEKGGLHSGGITMYLPHHDAAFDAKDLLETHVDLLDRLGKALRIAVKLVNNAQINRSVQMKYISFTTGWGVKLQSGDVKLEECESQLGKFEECKGEASSERIEHWVCVLNRFIDAPLI